MKKLVDTEKAAKILNVSARTIRRWFESGRIEGQFVASKRGGKSGENLLVWIEEPEGQKSEVRDQKSEIRGQKSEVRGQREEIRGQKSEVRGQREEIRGQKEETKEKSILEVIDRTDRTNKTNKTEDEKNHPAIWTKNVPERCQRIANYRYALIQKFNEDLGGNGRPKMEIVKAFLECYNTGLLLPEIHKEIGEISRSTLYELIKNASRGGVDALIPQYGGAGISKITDHEKNLLLTLLLHQNRLKIGYAIRLAKDRLAFKNLPTPSSDSTLRRWVETFKKEHYDLWTLRREGEKALNDKVLPYIERDRNLLEVGEGLVADGHRLNFQIVNPFTGKSSRASLVMFWDWRSAYPLGWEIMLEENVQCIASALRNALLTLGKYPKWILMDNGKAFKAKIFTSDVDLTDTELAGMFARLNINAHFAMPYNAQAKPEERFFRVFGDWFERLMPSYTGASIEDKPAWTKRNEKLARKLHDPRVPNIQEVNEMMFGWREFYADQPSKGLDGKTPREIIEDSRQKAEGSKIDPDQLTYLMMAVEIKNVGRNGVTLFGQHYYDENLYGYRDRVLIRYSLSDLNRVYIFSARGEFLCEARPVKKNHPMASDGGAPGDMEAVKRAIAAKRSLKNQTVRLHKMLGSRSAEALPWREIVEEVPNVVKAIEKAEGQKRTNVVLLSPFVDAPLEASEHRQDACTTDEENGRRPWFGDNEYEAYDWLQKHPEAVTDQDHAWMEDFLSRSSLYKNAARG